MKVTHFGVDGFPWAHVANFGGVNQIITLGSNTNTDPPLSALNYVQRITANGSNVMLNPIVNFAAGSNVLLTLDQGPLPAQAMPSNTIRIHSTGGGGGNIITANGSNSLAAVVNLVAGTGIALGVSGQNLTITNTSSGGGGGGSSGALVLLEQHTASSSATLDFTTFYSSTYDDYVLRIVGIRPATNTVTFSAQLSSNGGSSWNSTSNYYSSYTGRANDGSSVTGNSNPSSAWNFIDNVTNTSTRAIWGQLNLGNISSTATDKHLWGEMIVNTTVVATVVFMGILTVSGTAFNAIRFAFSSGNIAEGTIRVYGVVKT